MADKSVSIKGATDEQLREIILRLEMENRVQNLIADLKRKSALNNMSSYDCPQISTEEPIDSLYHKADDFLAHYGVLGMKWGVRRNRKASVSKAKSTKKPASNDDDDEVKKIPTKELKDITSRLQLEKQYKDLAPPKPGKKTDYERSLELKSRGYQNLSTQELKELTKRLQLEQQYKSLVPNNYQKGMNFVKAVTTAGSAITGLYALYKSPLGQDIKKALSGAKGA